MPKTSKSDKVYSSLNNVYILIILIVIMAIGILGAIAFPYYISPITYSNGGVPQAGGIAFLATLLIAGLLIGTYLLENRNHELGATFLIAVLLIIMAYVWIAYGSTAIKFLFNIS
ncbi:hypothetical protein [Sulfurisphaera ohwakuensis]|uniref:Uncharacterized protein n=1 Tax=Sulfurisphaera ohwakuensis TaxID=69656 RepID=A0A650CEB8_SULOH|nr:hypothetical protein [Sulfurisphaera ohwakuensis]MBB5252949.1 hypothetical protein [Sulfurisphaera ohwakuensis]QGR16122.1 hypothetical protein D1869_02145 [Sulfurisphaera ohwakuensis]